MVAMTQKRDKCNHQKRGIYLDNVRLGGVNAARLCA